MLKTKAFYFEDFCTDISRFLKEHELEFISFSPENLIPNRVDENKLAVLLGKFWNATETP